MTIDVRILGTGKFLGVWQIFGTSGFEMVYDVLVNNFQQIAVILVNLQAQATHTQIYINTITKI